MMAGCLFRFISVKERKGQRIFITSGCNLIFEWTLEHWHGTVSDEITEFNGHNYTLWEYVQIKRSVNHKWNVIFGCTNVDVAFVLKK